MDANMSGTGWKYSNFAREVPGDKRFHELMALRSMGLTTIRECSALTKPSVLPPLGWGPGMSLTPPESGLGNRLVSNLVSQLLLILFPPAMSFFKLDLEAADLKRMAQQMALDAEGTTMYDEMRTAFVSLENYASQRFDVLGLREKVRMLLEKMVVTGGSCYIKGIKEPSLRIMLEDDWVCLRGPSGDVIEAVYRDTELDPRSDMGYRTVYNRCRATDKRRWTLQRYYDGDIQPFTTVTFKDDNSFPVHFPVWELVAGEDYGRGPVEESLGDFRMWNAGARVLRESNIALSKVIFMLRPSAMTKASDVASANNCEIVSGDKDDIGVIQANKAYDFQGFVGYLSGIKLDLEMAFMSPNVIRRDAERVTAEEIRRMAAEFEKSKGGVYSTLARTLQEPLAHMLLVDALKRGALEGLKLSDLQPIISAGLEGLGRTLELENFLGFLQDVARNQYQMMIKPDRAITRLALLRGLELGDMLKSMVEIQQEAADAQDTQIAGAVGPDIIKGALQG